MLNTIIHGDCLEVMKQIPIPDKSIDMILCDLPYGVTSCKWDSVIPFEPLWEQYERVIKDNGAIVLTASQPFTSALVMSNPKLFKYCWVWVKNTATGIAQAKYQPMKYHEDVCVFYKKKPTYNPIKIPRTEGSQERLKYKLVNGGNGNHITLNKHVSNYDQVYKNPSTVIYFDTPPNSKGKLHPTQKPIALFEYLIRTYTNEGDTVLDNCVGSGTTAVACINTGRVFIGIEQEQKYVDIANERVKKAMGNERLLG